MNKKSLKNKKNKNEGITLIALVVTIIVLLILAGVVISTLTGDNGILTKVNEAKEEQRGATVEEHVKLWRTESEQIKILGENNYRTTREVVEELLQMNLITENEKDIIIGNEEKKLNLKIK